MIWIWPPVVALAFLLILLLWPVHIEFRWSPVGLSFSWFGLRMDWEENKGGNFRLWLFNFPFDQPTKAKPPKPNGQKKTKRPSKAKAPPWFRPINYELLKKTWQAPAFQAILKTSWDFAWRIRHAVQIKEFKGSIGALDYFQTGILTGLLAGLPETKTLNLKTSFTGEHHLMLAMKFTQWRVAISLIIWASHFPYKSFRQLYRMWIHPARIK